MIVQKTIIAFLTLLLTFQVLGLNANWQLGLTEEKAWEGLSDNPMEQDEETDGEDLKLDKIEFYGDFTKEEAALILAGQAASQYGFSESIPLKPFRELLSPPPNSKCFIEFSPVC